MRALYFIAWLMISAFVVWYMLQYNDSGNTQEVINNTSLSSDVKVIDEVSGSIYTGNDNESELDSTSSEESTTQRDTIINSKTSNKTNYPFLEVAYIQFNQNKVSLPKIPHLEKYFDSIAVVIENEELMVELVGHADKSLSNKRNNLQVGMKRAEFVRDELLKRNVDPSKISVDSKGATQPRIDEVSKEANKKNRRVELFLKPIN